MRGSFALHQDTEKIISCRMGEQRSHQLVFYRLVTTSDVQWKQQEEDTCVTGASLKEPYTSSKEQAPLLCVNLHI